MRYFRVLILSLVLVTLLVNIFPVTAQNTDDDTLLLEVGRGEVQFAAWNPGGTEFQIQTWRNTLWTYDRATLTEISSVKNVSFQDLIPSDPLSHEILDFSSQSPDGTKLFTSRVRSGRMTIYEVETGKTLVDVFHNPKRSASEQVFTWYYAVWSPNSQEILVWEQTGGLQLLDANSGKVIQTFSEFNSIGNTVEYSPDSGLVAVSDSRGYVYIYNTITGEQISVLRNIHQDPVTTILWSPDGTFVATRSYFDASTSGTEEQTKVMIWDALSGNHVYTIDHIGRADGFAWHPDGDYLASASNQYLTLWYPPPHQPATQQWSNGEGRWAELIFCPNTEFLLINSNTASHGGATLTVRDAQTLEILDRVDASHQQVYCTEDGYRLGEPTVPNHPEHNLPGKVVFSPDGKTYVHSWQGVIELYRVGE